MVTSHVNVGHAPFFDGDGSNLDYWKTCMRIHLKAMGGTLWKVVDEGFVVLDEANPTQADDENIIANAQAMNVIIHALCIREYHRVCKLEAAHEMWEKLIEAHEGTLIMTSRRLHLYSTHLIVSWKKVNRMCAKVMSLLMMILLKW
jgi:hypothetical protein